MNNNVKNVVKWVVSQRVARMVGGKRMAQVSLLIGAVNAIRYMRARQRTA